MEGNLKRAWLAGLGVGALLVIALGSFFAHRLERRLQAIEGKEPPPPPGVPTAQEVADLRGQIAGLQGEARSSMALMERRLQAIEGKEPAPPGAPTAQEVEEIRMRVAAIEARPQSDEAPLASATELSPATFFALLQSDPSLLGTPAGAPELVLTFREKEEWVASGPLHRLSTHASVRIDSVTMDLADNRERARVYEDTTSDKPLRVGASYPPQTKAYCHRAPAEVRYRYARASLHDWITNPTGSFPWRLRILRRQGGISFEIPGPSDEEVSALAELPCVTSLTVNGGSATNQLVGALLRETAVTVLLLKRVKGVTGRFLDSDLDRDVPLPRSRPRVQITFEPHPEASIDFEALETNHRFLSKLVWVGPPSSDVNDLLSRLKAKGVDATHRPSWD